MATSQEAIGDWRTRLQAQIAAIVVSYKNQRTWADVYADASKWWTIATKFQGEANKIANITQDQRDDITDAALALGELKYLAKTRPQISYLSPNEVGGIVPKLTAPLQWLQSVGQPILERQALIQDTVPELAKLPSNALKWMLQQILASLGLPSWTLPVVGVVAIGGLGLWTYNTFMAPAGQAITIAKLAAKTRGGRAKRRARLA